MPRIKKEIVDTANGTASLEPVINASQDDNVQVPASLLAELQSQLKEQGKELQKLKKGAAPKTGQAERYEGPRAYSYSTWTTEDGEQKIVTDWVTRKINPSFDLVYKNQYGQYVDNQGMELTFHDGSKVTVTHFDYGMQHGRSDKLFTVGTKIMKGADNKTSTFYVFDVNGQEVPVSERAINQ
jgi:hypothetical protein